MAIDLIKRNKCHNFVILEKSSSIGGTWHDNKYPGACCDVSEPQYNMALRTNNKLQ
jgi:cation diffusion facilitator CzcD-associated flavoprotein CzcO